MNRVHPDQIRDIADSGEPAVVLRPGDGGNRPGLTIPRFTPRTGTGVDTPPTDRSNPSAPILNVTSSGLSDRQLATPATPVAPTVATNWRLFILLLRARRS